MGGLGSTCSRRARVEQLRVEDYAPTEARVERADARLPDVDGTYGHGISTARVVIVAGLARVDWHVVMLSTVRMIRIAPANARLAFVGEAHKGKASQPPLRLDDVARGRIAAKAVSAQEHLNGAT